MRFQVHFGLALLMLVHSAPAFATEQWVDKLMLPPGTRLGAPLQLFLEGGGKAWSVMSPPKLPAFRHYPKRYFTKKSVMGDGQVVVEARLPLNSPTDLIERINITLRQEETGIYVLPPELKISESTGRERLVQDLSHLLPTDTDSARVRYVEQKIGKLGRHLYIFPGKPEAMVVIEPGAFSRVSFLFVPPHDWLSRLEALAGVRLGQPYVKPLGALSQADVSAGGGDGDGRATITTVGKGAKAIVSAVSIKLTSPLDGGRFLRLDGLPDTEERRIDLLNRLKAIMPLGAGRPVLQKQGNGPDYFEYVVPGPKRCLLIVSKSSGGLTIFIKLSD